MFLGTFDKLFSMKSETYVLVLGYQEREKMNDLF